MRKTKLFMAFAATLLIMSFAVSASAGAQEAYQGVTCGTEAAYGGNTAEVRKANIYWRYKFKDGKVYKRLFDYDKNMWIGDWILCK